MRINYITNSAENYYSAYSILNAVVVMFILCPEMNKWQEHHQLLNCKKNTTENTYDYK